MILYRVKLDCGHEGYWNVECHPFPPALLHCQTCEGLGEKAINTAIRVTGRYDTKRQTLQEALKDSTWA